MARPKIVITGMGGICALGNDVPAIWDSMAAGRSGISALENTDTTPLQVKVGAEIKALPDHGLERRRLITMDRFSVLAVIAAKEALAQSGLKVDETNTHRVGAIVGTGVYGAETADENYHAVLVHNKPRANVFTVPRIMPGAPAGQVSMEFGLRGPVFGVTSACSSTNHALASAFDQLVLGRADAIVVGGTEAPLSFGIMKSWEALRVLSPDVCRPFSKDRQGLVIGEGAGMLVLETEEHAKARGATILAELAGIGLSGDASDIVAPTVDGPASAMAACLADAGLKPEDVDYLNAHGTGTNANDQIETQAIKRVFGPAAAGLSVSSTKSMHGHCLGASGAIEMLACILALQKGIVPPTIGYREPDPDCDLDVTPNEARQRDVRVALSNAFAFGGTNAVVALRRA